MALGAVPRAFPDRAEDFAIRSRAGPPALHAATRHLWRMGRDNGFPVPTGYGELLVSDHRRPLLESLPVQPAHHVKATLLLYVRK